MHEILDWERVQLRTSALICGGANLETGGWNVAGMAVDVHQSCFSISQDATVTFQDVRRAGTPPTPEAGGRMCGGFL